MSPYLAEYLGTFLLILFGVGVCANSSLRKAYGYKAGWVLIAFGWGFGVFVGVVVAGPYSGAHINPAVSIGLAVTGQFSWSLVSGYIVMQLLGAFTGALLAWYLYSDQYNDETDSTAILGTFSTGPAIRNLPKNLFSEVLGTFILVFVVLYISGAKIQADNLENAKIGLGAVGALPVAILVVAIGMSLGGTTGYAINPARDLGPRIVHALVPIINKGDSNWRYAWIPVVGPVLGGVLAGFLFLAIS